MVGLLFLLSWSLRNVKCFWYNGTQQIGRRVLMEHTKVERMDHILQYYKMKEFFQVENYPDVYKICRSAKRSEPIVEFAVDLKLDKDLETLLRKEATSMEKSHWSNLCVYLGKVQRDACLKAMSTYVQKDVDVFDQTEWNKDYMPLCSLELDCNGVYVSNSMMVSPIVFAMHELEMNPIKVERLFDCGRYEETMRKLDGLFVPGEVVSIDQLKGILKQLEEVYLSHLKDFSSDHKPVFFEAMDAVFYLYQNEELYQKNKHARVSNGFFRKGIQEELTSIEHGVRSDALCSFMDSFEEKMDEHERVDLLHRKSDQSHYLQQLHGLLDMEYAPLAKWPSLKMPTFMEQIALNHCLHDDSFMQAITVPVGGSGEVFVKELLASCVVEKAKVFSQYETSDDGFEVVHGKSCNWYQLKDRSLCKQSLFVVSDEDYFSRVVKDLKEELTPKYHISTDSRKPLSLIRKLFDASYSGMEEVIVSGNQDPIVLQDLYFSKQASDLYNISGKQNAMQSAWGLMGVKLTDQEDLYHLNQYFLEPLLKMYLHEEAIVSRGNARYEYTRKIFLKQLDRVHQKQEELESYKILPTLIKEEKLQSDLLKAKYETSLNAYEKSIRLTRIDIEHDEEKLKELECEITSLEETINAKDTMVQDVKNAIYALDLKIDENQKSAREKSKSVSMFGKLFHSKASQEVEEELLVLKDALSSLQGEMSSLQDSLRTYEQEEAQLQLKSLTLHEEVESLRSLIVEKEVSILEVEKKREECVSLLEHCEDRLITLKRKYRDAVESFKGSNGFTARKSLDPGFVSRLMSDDLEISSKAFLDNPWFHESYNREREKLFNTAVRFLRECVLSSKALACNMALLQSMLKFKNVELDAMDEVTMATSLFESLCFVVPMVQTTPYFLGVLLKDCKKEDSFGYIVYDHGERLDVHEVFGGLKRFAKTIVMGDVRQVKKKSKDDLRFLMSLYEDDVCKAYAKCDTNAMQFANLHAKYGTYLAKFGGDRTWVGIPFVVNESIGHPMGEICNAISYDGILKHAVSKKVDDETPYLLDKSHVFHVVGKQIGPKIHYVEDQGDKVVYLLNKMFKKYEEGTYPDVMIVSPFVTVVSGLRNTLRKAMNDGRLQRDVVDYMISSSELRMGTVEQLASKSAKEVILVLGCDASKDNALAIQTVDEDVVNVMVSKARERLYVVCDKDVWVQSPAVDAMIEWIDLFEIKA